MGNDSTNFNDVHDFDGITLPATLYLFIYLFIIMGSTLLRFIYYKLGRRPWKKARLLHYSRKHRKKLNVLKDVKPERGQDIADSAYDDLNFHCTQPDHCGGATASDVNSTKKKHPDAFSDCK